MHKQTERQHFHAETTSAKLYIYIGVRSRDLFIDKAHTALGMLPVFLPCMHGIITFLGLKITVSNMESTPS